MKVLLDQGLPRTAVLHLEKANVSATHAADVGLSTASDATILKHGREHGLVVVTLDADFHAQLALSRAAAPSVIRIRMEGLRGAGLAKLIAEVIAMCAHDLEQGAMVSVTETGIRVRRIPLLR